MDVLDGYTTEQIEELARKYIENRNVEKKELKLKIAKIDKNYRKHNERAVITAITNGTVIIALAAVFMKSDINISEFGNDRVMQLINESYEWVNQIADNIPMGDMVSTIYAKLMGVLEIVIDKIGVIGIILANRAISLATNTVKNGIKTVKMKKEMEEIREKLRESYHFEQDNKSK